ncbi:hypothetical protein PaG_02371 [Moesziomyces aphidis]|uniref:Uncharacterized protein n=1 Tax=Moesziomyces aphidis TaxID=84754 RepID=W3VR29_MOEAP|nr:hypothetical protein PaG_02371 [Moesziomyces aphidis]
MVVVAGQAGEFDGDADDASTVPQSSKEGSAQAFHRVRCASGERVAAADGRNPKRVREVRKPSAATSASSSSLEAVQTSGTALQTNQPSLHKAFVADDRPKREVGGAGGSSERSPKKTRHGVVGSGADCRVSAQPRPIQSQPINTSPVPPPRHMQLPAASHPSLAAPSNGLR